MLSKIIAASDRTVSVQVKKQQKPTVADSLHQRGVTLIELMVGIAIGLLVITVAMGALMVSRGISGTVSDASSIQQQAAYAMRVVGLQLRQAGSLRLNLDPGTAVTEARYMVPVAFEANPLNLTVTDISGTSTPVTFAVGYSRYTEPVFTSLAEQALSRNCLGGPADSSTDVRVDSLFSLDTAANTLRCDGNSAGAQPILQNVANFQVRYLLQDNTTTLGAPTIKSVDADAVNVDPTNWARVQGVEVCLVLYGNEAIDLPAGSNYTDCNGNPVDMSTLTGTRAKRMHIPFRNVFQLRSQGLSAVL